MKVALLAFFLAFVASVSCNHGTETNPQFSEVQVEIEGTVRYYVDTLVWIGGECDPSGFILSNYRWRKGEPTFGHNRVYVKDSTLAPYLTMNVQIEGKLDTIFAGGLETSLRKFPFVEVKRVLVIR